jgi:hypothetical protein
MPRPYQPSLLRLLHGFTALLVPLAWLTGLLVYSSHDGRFGSLPFRLPGEWIDIHGTVGVLLWPIALLFEDWLREGQFQHVVYSLHLLAWLLIALAVALHVSAVLRRGGLSLARSMASVELRSGDLPGQWFDQIRRSFKARS